MGARGPRRTLIGAFAVAAVAVRVLFWIVTERRFEDALTTIAHSRNAADGLGLTHHAGEPATHGFTSALSALVPLLGELVADGGGFTAIRLASLAAAALSVVAGGALAARFALGTWPTVLVLAFLAFDQGQIFYGMAGMETQIAVCVLLWTAVAMTAGRIVWAGAGLGLCLLARPDVVLFVAPAALWLVLAHRRRALPALAAGAAVLAPWLAFTTLYYGSPVPNTIGAKAAAARPELATGWDFLWRDLAPFTTNTFIVDTPVPQRGLQLFALLVAVLAVAGIARSVRRPGWWPACVFALAFPLYKLVLIPAGYSGWYVPPWAAVVVLLAAVGLQAVARLVPRRLPAVVAGGLALGFALHLPFTLPLERRVQRDVEARVREPLGRWLARSAGGETVTSESAGYVGYYGRGIVLRDFPGLTSKVVTRHWGEVGESRVSLQALIADLRPRWAVLRPGELETLRSVEPSAARGYAEVRRFRVEEAATPLRRWGVVYASIDREFVVLRRR